MVSSARPDTDRRRPRRDPRPGSLSRRGPGTWTVLLGAARNPAPAEPRQRLQGARKRPRHKASAPWLSRALGKAGGIAAQQRADGRNGPRRLSPRAWLGALHRPHYPRGEHEAGTGRVHALGQLCAEEGFLRRHVASPRLEGSPSFAPVGSQRLPRVPPFLKGKCVPRKPRPVPDRLGVARSSYRRVEAGPWRPATSARPARCPLRQKRRCSTTCRTREAERYTWCASPLRSLLRSAL